MKRIHILFAAFIAGFFCSNQLIKGQVNPMYCENYLNYVHAIAVDKDNTIWFGSDGGLVKYNKGLWTVYDITYGAINLIVDNNGKLWFGNRNGARSFDGTDVKFYLQDISNPENEHMVYDLAIDKYGNKWFGTAEGIYKYNDSHWTNYNETDGLINNKVRSIAVDSSNTVWIGTNFGLSKFDGSAWVSFYAKTDIHPEGKLPDETIGKIVIGKNGHLYLLHDSYGFSEYDGKDFKVYNTETSKLISNAVSALAIDLKGDIWVGTPYGITLIHDSISVNYTTNDGLIDNGVSDIKIDILGNIWISTFKGISMFDGLKFVNYKCTNINIDSYVLTNISSEETEKSNNIFPNPVNSYFQIPDSKFNNGNFSIRDITGKFICQKRIQENNVDVDDLKPGLYIVTLMKGSSSCNLKIIKK